MPVRAVLFDFDGTLADSFDAIIASAHYVRQSFGLPPLPAAKIRSLVGHGLVQFMEDLCPGYPTDEAVRLYREHHPSVMAAGTRLMPGVMETLKALHERGLKLAVCSNKAVSFTKDLIHILKLDTIMSEVLGPDDVDGKVKPDPAMLLEALKRFNVSPNEAVYVGDMSVDVLAGNAAGIPVWLVHIGMVGGDDPRTAGPSTVLADFGEIGELINR
jgi:phosphoglycolate phosphatase